LEVFNLHVILLVYDFKSILLKFILDLFFYFKGLSAEIALTKSCMNVPEGWGGQANSIDSSGLCVNLFVDQNCFGENTTVLHSQNNLDEIGYKEVLRSVKLCENVTLPGNLETKLGTRWIILSTGLLVIMLIIIATGIILCVKGNPKRLSRGKLAENDIQDFFNGFSDVYYSSSSNQQDQQVAFYCDPYDRQYEIGPSYLLVGKYEAIWAKLRLFAI